MAKQVAIIGAGIAGLAAAETIHALDSSIQVTVFEALNRIGGRAYTDTINGDVMDWGCEALEAGDKAPTVVLKASGTPLNRYTKFDDKAIAATFEPTDCGIKVFYDTTSTSATDVTKAVEGTNASNSASYKQFEQNIEAVSFDPMGPASDDILHKVTMDFGDKNAVAERMALLSRSEIFSEGAEPGMASLRDLNRSEQIQAEFGQEAGTVYFKEGLGATVVKWATDNVVGNLTLKKQVPVSEVKNIQVDAEEEDDPPEDKVLVSYTEASTPKTGQFDAAIVAVPSNGVTSTLVPELSQSAVTAFRNCPLGTYYKLAVEGYTGTVSVPPKNRRVFATLESLGDVIHIGQSPNGKFCFMHASGFTGDYFARKPEDAEVYLQTALNGLNGGALNFSNATFTHCPWFTTPQFGGSYSYCATGHDDARLALASLNVGNIYFAGEACSPIWYGQLAGAMESGQRMARLLVERFE